MKSILVPTDFSEPSRQAVNYALALAYAWRAEMLLLHVVEGEPVRRYVVRGKPEVLPSWIDSTGSLVWWHSPQTIIQHDLYEEAQWKLSALIPPGSFENSHRLVTVGEAADEIVRVARERKADLIVLGAEGKRRLRRVFSRGVARQVIRKAPVPVMMLYTFGRTILPPQRIPDLPWLSDLDFNLSLRRTGERRELDEMVPW